MAQPVGNLDPTRRLFEELKSKNEDARTRASNELRETLNSLSRGEQLSFGLPLKTLLIRGCCRMVAGKVYRILQFCELQNQLARTVPRTL
jgi:hypothetical protein